MNTREVVAILRQLIAECVEHNKEYQHLTPEGLLARARELVRHLEREEREGDSPPV